LAATARSAAKEGLAVRPEISVKVPVASERIPVPYCLARKLGLYQLLAHFVTFSLLTWWSPWTGFLVHFVLTTLFAVPAARPAKVTIGDDGIHLRWWSVERFISYETLTEVRKERHGVALCLAGGEQIQLRASGYAGHFRERVAWQLEQRMAQWQRYQRVELPASGGGELAYRAPSYTLESRVDVAVNPRSAPEARVRAIEELAGEVDERTTEKLSESAASTAHPRVRRALEEAALPKVRETESRALRIVDPPALGANALEREDAGSEDERDDGKDVGLDEMSQFK
jgi:hypothetical protein